MRKSRSAALALMLLSCLHSVEIGNTGVLCAEIDGHVLVERLFECWSEAGDSSDEPACGPCVDVPLQTLGQNAATPIPGAHLSPDPSAVVVTPLDSDTAGGAIAISFDAAGRPFLLEHPALALSTVLRF